jgi:hypothetical protein
MSINCENSFASLQACMRDKIEDIKIWTPNYLINLTIYFLLHLWPSLHNTTHTSKDPNQIMCSNNNISSMIVLTKTFLSMFDKG